MRFARALILVLASTGGACSSSTGVSGSATMPAGAGGASAGNAGAGGAGNAGAPGSAGMSGSAAGSGGMSGSAAGSAGTSGSAAGSAGTAGSAGAGGGTACKRGIAANTAPGPAFFPAVSWWYNWSNKGSGQAAGIEFTPMIWGAATLGGTVPAGSHYLLGFNEPNFHAQSNLTPQQAAADWPQLEALAKSQNLPIVSPAVNFCGPASDCNGTDPYQYLKDFFAACTGCQVDYVAVHWYDNFPSLQDYLEPGGSLQGFEQFGRPIWLTEFSLNGSASASQQQDFMNQAIPYLESNPHVFRYSWFSADPIPNGKLINSDGTPTALGQIYISLPQSCQ